MDMEKTINKLKQIEKFAIKNDMPGLEKTAKSAIELLKDEKKYCDKCAESAIKTTVELQEEIARLRSLLKEQETQKFFVDENGKITPLPVVVRCKDCKWWDKKDGANYGYCHACKHRYYSDHWEIGIYRTYKGDWFCADGEHK